MDNTGTQGFIDTSNRVFPGGVLGRHQYGSASDHLPVSGEGPILQDSEGRSFIDYSCGGGSLILGYSHPSVVAAVSQQAHKATQFVSIRNQPAIELANCVTELVSWVDKVRFTLSGAEAVMMALRLARAYTNRDKVLKFDGAYHGNCDYSLWNKSHLGTDAVNLPSSAGIPDVIQDLVLVAPFNDLSATREIVRRHCQSLAAIIIEPVQRSYAADAEFLFGLRELCDEFDIVLVFDEIVTGFRHALGGAAEVFKVEPDLGAFGKALGGGLPVGAVCGRPEIMDHADPERGTAKNGYAYVTSSQAGNPLGAAAGIATLNELSKPGVLASMHRRAEALKSGLSELILQHDIEAQVVGYGPLWDLAFASEPITDHASAQKADQSKLLKFHHGLIRNGVMVRAGGRSYFSTAHHEEHIEQTLRAAEIALKEM